MTSNPPISFAAKAKSAGNPASGGYPYTLSGTDLDQNFTFATSAYDKQHFNVTSTIGSGAHAQREVKLKVPIEAGTAAGQIAVWSGTTWTPSIAPPALGTHVLGSVNGTLQWISTKEC
jgi:hypothetical protein